ncbi:MAG: O-antigen ligase family protein, partial [Patescibacteria group bacterium]
MNLFFAMTTSLSNFSLLVRKHPLVTMGVLGLGIVSVLAMRWISPMIILFGWIGGVIGGIAIIHPWIGLLLMTFALPFEYLGSVEVLGMTVRASQMLLGFTATGTLLIFLGKRQKFRLEHPTFFWLPILLLAGMASLAQSENLARGFLVWGFIAFTSLLLWIVPQIIRSTERVDLLIRILFWSAMIVSLFGLVQFLGDLVGLPGSLTGLRPQYTKAILGFPRVQSTMFEPLYFANYLLIPLSLAATIFLSQSRPSHRHRILLLFVLGGLSLILTVSRGGYLAFAVSMIVISLWYARQFFSPKIWLTGTILASVIIAAAAIFLFSSQATQEFLFHASNLFGGASYLERVDTFAAAWRTIVQHPIFGIGMGNFGPWFAPHPLLSPETGWAIVNNEYIEVWAEMGIVGLASFMGFIAALIIPSIQAIHRATPYRYEGAIMIGLFAAFMGTLVQYLTFAG